MSQVLLHHPQRLSHDPQQLLPPLADHPAQRRGLIIPPLPPTSAQRLPQFLIVVLAHSVAVDPAQDRLIQVHTKPTIRRQELQELRSKSRNQTGDTVSTLVYV